MRLKTTGLTLLVSALACLGTASAASAASSPTATANAASGITTTTATINATVTPNGASTNYYFSYGPTTALGTNSPQHTLAASKANKASAVAYTLSGLESGTTYYYDLTAVSSAGTSVTKVVSFKTGGVTPAVATTGGASVLSANSATLTGVVNTQNTTTEYYFQYGLTDTYGLQTNPQQVTPSASPVAVSFTVPGLAPGQTFHYRLVAVNGPNNTSYGTDASLYTFPDPVPTPRLNQSVTPRTAKHRPYVLTTSGFVVNPSAAPAADACTGSVTAAFYYKKRLLHRLTMPVGPACQFFGKSSFRSLPVKGVSSAQIQVDVRFNGNPYLKAHALKPQTVTLG